MRAYITLNMNNLLSNYSRIYKENPSNLYLVVKANAYGHGLTQIISMLSKNEGEEKQIKKTINEWIKQIQTNV